MDFPTLSSRILDDALQMGAEAAEVFAKTGSSTDLHMHQGRIESVATAEEEGVGIRFELAGGRWGYCYTADLSPDNVGQVLEEAFQGAGSSDEEAGADILPGAPGVDLPDARTLGIFSPDIAGTPTGRKVDFIRAVEAAALEAGPKVRWVDTLLYHDGWAEVHLRNSNGFHETYRQTLAYVVVHVMAGDDDEAIMSHHVEAACSLHGLDAEAIGNKAGYRAAAPLGGRRIGPRSVTVVLDAPVASQLLEYLAPSVLGRTYQRGRSLFQGRLGEPVAAPGFTLVDDGRLPGGLSTTPFDGEGSPTGKTVLVREGVLTNLLHDRRTAAAQKTETTGNAMRSSYRDLPKPGVTNLYVVPGTRPTSEILIDLDQAFYAMNVMHVGGVNPVTGNLSVAASGMWMEEGRERYPVSGVTLSGDLNQILKGIVAVGDDMAWHHAEGSCGSPSLVVEGLTVAG
jgi:PmbA protein